MKHSFLINQRAIVELGIQTVDFNDLAVFEFCRSTINWKGSVPTVHDGDEYKWVSYQFIKENVPLLDCSTKTIYRIVDRLCNARLLKRCPVNKKESMVFLAMGDIGIEYELYDNTNTVQESTRTDLSKHKDKSVQVTRTDLSKHYIVNNTKLRIREKEKRAQEIEKEQPSIEVQPLEIPVQKSEQPSPPRISTRDIPFCEGHGVKIFVNEYPQQAEGVPFCHPSLAIERIPFMQRIDVWWKLYGVDQGKGKCDAALMQNNMADDDNFAKLYLHTFLYVATQAKEYRAKPEHYLKNRMWLDEIIDRRPKKIEEIKEHPSLRGQGPSTIMRYEKD